MEFYFNGLVSVFELIKKKFKWKHVFFYQMSLPLPASSQNYTKMKNHSSLMRTNLTFPSCIRALTLHFPHASPHFPHHDEKFWLSGDIFQKLKLVEGALLAKCGHRRHHRNHCHRHYQSPRAKCLAEARTFLRAGLMCDDLNPHLDHEQLEAAAMVQLSASTMPRLPHWVEATDVSWRSKRPRRTAEEEEVGLVLRSQVC